MGLDFAIDALYASGWSTLDSSGCEHHADGRLYPSTSRVERYFTDHGFELAIRHVPVFDCYRAEWKDQGGSACGAVVGASATEAAVFAMAHLRRQVAMSSLMA